MNLVPKGTKGFFPPTHSSRCKRKAPTVPPVQQPEIGGDAIKVQRLLNSSWPSRGDPFPPVLVMETAENHASHNLAILGKGMFVVILQRRGYRGTFGNPRSEAQMRAPLVVRVDNATPIILNREKSITLGILGTLSPWRSTKLSPGMGELCADAASMRTQEFGSWRSRNGCSIRWPAAICAWRRCLRSTAVHCWI